MSDPGLESLYREVILDHYKNPRGHGLLEDADAHAEGQNPLCGDEVSIYVAFGEDGETIDEVKFSGRGCAISQAATAMLMELPQGGTRTGARASPASRTWRWKSRRRRVPGRGAAAGHGQDRPHADARRGRLQLRRRAL